jgi:hypothetical protein
MSITGLHINTNTITTILCISLPHCTTNKQQEEELQQQKEVVSEDALSANFRALSMGEQEKRENTMLW